MIILAKTAKRAQIWPCLRAFYGILWIVHKLGFCRLKTPKLAFWGRKNPQIFTYPECDR